MTAKEAYLILLKKVSGVRVATCYEYDSLFVFQLAPAGLRLFVNPSPMLDALMSVDKATGKVRDFKPFMIPIDEYRRGKEVPPSVYKKGVVL